MTDAALGMIEHVEVQVLVLLLVAAFVAMGARRSRLPYTLALVVAGLVLGFLELEVLHDVELNADLLLLLLLPALLFEAAFHIDLREFRRNLAPIFALAVPGVLLAATGTAVLLYLGLGSTGWVHGFGWREAWLFAAVIAATDPVSVLALFRQFGVTRRLYLIVEGESLLNDGVAVVLFTVILGVFGLSGETPAATGTAGILAYGLETFLRMGGGGALIGLVLGGAFTLLTRTVDDHLIETALSTLLAYGSFLLAEELHCSGVLSTVFAGIVAGSFGAKLGMSASSRNAVEDFWEFAAFLANSFIFLLVGLELDPGALLAEIAGIAIAFVAVLGARAVVVYVGVPLSSRFSEPLPRAWSHILVAGGLRGSLSMVLILTLPSTFPGRSLLVNLVFGVVALSLFVQGLGMGPLLRRLGLLDQRERHDAYERARATNIMARRAIEELAALERDTLIEPAVADRLRRWYEDRAQHAQEQAKTALGSAQMSEQLVEGMRRLADAERRGLREAQEAAIVDVEIAEALDRELVVRRVTLEETAEMGPEEVEAMLDTLLASRPTAEVGSRASSP